MKDKTRKRLEALEQEVRDLRARQSELAGILREFEDNHHDVTDRLVGSLEHLLRNERDILRQIDGLLDTQSEVARALRVADREIENLKSRY